MTTELRYKLLTEDAQPPTRAHEGDAGLDLFCSGYGDRYLEYRTGVAVEIPPGYVGLLFPRSSIRDTGLILANSVGVIDSGYRGEICVTFREMKPHSVRYGIGDKIAQLVIVPIPQVTLVQVDTLGSTDRGTGGHGSTGK